MVVFTVVGVFWVGVAGVGAGVEERGGGVDSAPLHGEDERGRAVRVDSLEGGAGGGEGGAHVRVTVLSGDVGGSETDVGLRGEERGARVGGDGGVGEDGAHGVEMADATRAVERRLADVIVREGVRARAEKKLDASGVASRGGGADGVFPAKARVGVHAKHEKALHIVFVPLTGPIHELGGVVDAARAGGGFRRRQRQGCACNVRTVGAEAARVHLVGRHRARLVRVARPSDGASVFVPRGGKPSDRYVMTIYRRKVQTQVSLAFDGAFRHTAERAGGVRG